MAVSAAHAEGFIKNLIARLRGETLPAGIVKSNGRIEATQVDVSSKYAGRLAEVHGRGGVERLPGAGDRPDLLAGIRGAASRRPGERAERQGRPCGRRGRDHLAPERARIRQVRFSARPGADEDRLHHQAGVRAAQAQLRFGGRGGDELHLAEGSGAVQDQELRSGGRTHRIDHPRPDARLAAQRPRAVPARARGRGRRGRRADRHHPRSHRRLHDDLPAGGGRGAGHDRRRGAHRPRSDPRSHHSRQRPLRRGRRAVHARRPSRPRTSARS